MEFNFCGVHMTAIKLSSVFEYVRKISINCFCLVASAFVPVRLWRTVVDW